MREGDSSTGAWATSGTGGWGTTDTTGTAATGTTAAGTVVTHPSFLHRHWQGALMAAASVMALALAAGTVLPGLGGSGSDSLAGYTASDSSAAVDGSTTPEAAVAEGPAADEERLAGADGSAALADKGGEVASSGAGAATGSGITSEDSTDDSLVRSGTLLVGTEDVEGGRDSFVATILALGGRVTSETVVTEDGNGAQPYPADMSSSRDMGMSYPYPWYPTGPGIWLSVQVPVDQYDKAIEAARSTGEVVQMQQSTYDVGAQMSDVDARIKALEASLVRLTSLMDEAESISDVIALEQAIAQRQSELDALLAQQRELANQTAMSQISLTLMSPEDAKGTVDPQPEQTWWESFLAGLDDLWAWLGQALLIVSPLLIAGAIIWWVRRRQRRTSTAAAQSAGPSAGTRPEDPAGAEG